MSDMTPAQQAQQNNRDSEGQYTHKQHEEQTLGAHGVDLTGARPGVAPDSVADGVWHPARAVENYRNDIAAWRTVNTQIEVFAEQFYGSQHYASSPGGAVARSIPRMIKTIYFTPEGKRARELKKTKARMDLQNLRDTREAGLSTMAKTDEDRAYFGAMVRAGLYNADGSPRVPMQYDRATGYPEPALPQ